MEKDKCFICFEENLNLYICCHICTPLACSNCIDMMNKIYENVCTICNSKLPIGHRKIEIGCTSKMSVLSLPKLFYLETDEKPKLDFYSIKVKGKIIHNVLKFKEYEGKFFLLNSGFPFHFFESFSILYDKKTLIRSIENVKNKPIIFKGFVPEIFVGVNIILYINNYNKMKILYENNIIYIEDFERVTKKFKYIYYNVTDNEYYLSLRREDNDFNCCNIL
jgi:hypothetical protein